MKKSKQGKAREYWVVISQDSGYPHAIYRTRYDAKAHLLNDWNDGDTIIKVREVLRRGE